MIRYSSKWYRYFEGCWRFEMNVCWTEPIKLWLSCTFHTFSDATFSSESCKNSKTTDGAHFCSCFRIKVLWILVKSLRYQLFYTFHSIFENLSIKFFIANYENLEYIYFSCIFFFLYANTNSFHHRFSRKPEFNNNQYLIISSINLIN